MGKLNASTLAAAAAAPAPAPKSATPKPATPKPATPKPAPADTSTGPVTTGDESGGAERAVALPKSSYIDPIVKRNIFDSSLVGKPSAAAGAAAPAPARRGPEAEPPPGPASGPPTGFYSTKMREVEALRKQRLLGTDTAPGPLFVAGKERDQPELTARAGPMLMPVRPKEGGAARVFEAYPTVEARTVPTSSQEEFVRRGERLGERYASLQRTLLDLADRRRELEAAKKANAPPGTTDANLKDLAGRTRRVNQDLAQTLADLREFGINEQEAEMRYGDR